MNPGSGSEGLGEVREGWKEAKGAKEAEGEKPRKKTGDDFLRHRSAHDVWLDRITAHD